MYPHNFMSSLTMALLQFLTCAWPQYHHFGQNWLVPPQNCTYIPKDKLTLGNHYRNLRRKMVTSQVSRQRSQTQYWVLLQMMQCPLKILWELLLHLHLVTKLCCELFLFKIKMHLKITILGQLKGKCLSQLIFTGVDFNARQDWRNYI